METYEQKLISLISEIDLIYIESKRKLPLTKKYENYNKIILLVGEAKKLIDLMQIEISNLDTSKVNKSQDSNLDRLIELLSLPNLNFTNLMAIDEQFRSISAGLPVSAEINDNVEKEVMIYDDDI